MLKLICAICICLAILPLFGQTPTKYEVATIMDVKTRQDSGSDVVRYDVSVKVGETVYLVLYTPPLGINTVRYAAGAQLLVRVNKKTITYNDLLGQPIEVPIDSQTPAAKQPK